MFGLVASDLLNVQLSAKTLFLPPSCDHLRCILVASISVGPRLAEAPRMTREMLIAELRREVASINLVDPIIEEWLRVASPAKLRLAQARLRRIKGRPVRRRSRIPPPEMTDADLQRFFANLVLTPRGCLLFDKGVQFRLGGRRWTPRRLVWAMSTGGAPSKGELIGTSCGKSRCVLAGHLTIRKRSFPGKVC